MNTPLISCPNCRTTLLEGVFNLPDLVPCPVCSTPLQVEVFPALFRRITPGREGETILDEAESSCFYHPQKKAVLPCDACGRFLCALCDCELNGQHLCPSCLEAGKTKGKIKSLENKRTVNDSIALSLAILPMLIPYLTIITAPLTLYVCIRHWKTPTSIIHRTRIRFVFALIIASLQIIGWIALITFFIAMKPAAKH